ncbi:MAG: hypothetical protein H6581_22825 [Bacteroidia bacterium]|nr:hypothetical protein [Bacteroidia bacterium]
MKNVISIGRAKYALLNPLSFVQFLTCNALHITRALLILLSLFSTLRAQETHDISEFPFEIQFPSGTLNQGDTAQISILLGNAQDPVDSLLGFQVYLNLTDKAEFSGPIPFDLTHSWLADDSLVDTLSGAVAASRQLTFECMRNDGNFRSGHGEIFSIQLVATQDEVDPVDLISAKGGLVIIDNGSFKMRSPQEEDPQVYPNPARDFVWISQADQVAVAQWIFPGGKVIQVELSGEAIQGIPLPAEAQGLLFLRLQLRNGRQIVRRILIQP